MTAVRSHGLAAQGGALGSEAGDLKAHAAGCRGDPKAPEAGPGPEQTRALLFPALPSQQGLPLQLGAGTERSVHEGRTAAKSVRGASICPDSQQITPRDRQITPNAFITGVRSGGLIYWQIHTHYKTQPSLD